MDNNKLGIEIIKTPNYSLEQWNEYCKKSPSSAKFLSKHMTNLEELLINRHWFSNKGISSPGTTMFFNNTNKRNYISFKKGFYDGDKYNNKKDDEDKEDENEDDNKDDEDEEIDREENYKGNFKPKKQQIYNSYLPISSNPLSNNGLQLVYYYDLPWYKYKMMINNTSKFDYIFYNTYSQIGVNVPAEEIILLGETLRMEGAEFRYIHLS